MDFLDYWKASKRWTDDGGIFIPAPKNFLNPDKSYLRTKPAPAKTNQTWSNNSERKMDEYELQAIRDMMSGKTAASLGLPEEEETEIESCS